jgi:5-methylcytosine-specific restriction endonuclease McrA
MRDRGRCTHSGCSSKHKLQYDHIKPLARGGETSVINLRLLCQTHNMLAARREYGEEKISGYLHKF